MQYTRLVHVYVRNDVAKSNQLNNCVDVWHAIHSLCRRLGRRHRFFYFFYIYTHLFISLKYLDFSHFCDQFRYIIYRILIYGFLNMDYSILNGKKKIN
jgi:hypothetical protein